MFFFIVQFGFLQIPFLPVSFVSNLTYMSGGGFHGFLTSFNSVFSTFTSCLSLLFHILRTLAILIKHLENPATVRELVT